MTFELRYTPEAKESLTRLAHAGLKHLAERSLLRIAHNPYQGTKLAGKLSGLYAARMTRRYRVLYTVSPDQRLIIILDIAHRREAYR